jgi:MinD-like ATPase involved in chromosome partitioning or flagellar assembly
VDGHGVQHLLLEVGPGDGGHVQLHRSEAERPVQVMQNLALLQASDSMRGVAAGDPARRARFRRLGPLYAGYDLVIVDGGSRLGSVLTACEAGVNLLLVVTTDDRICLAANYALVKAIGERIGERPVAVLGNRIDVAGARVAADMIDSATRHFLERTVRFAGAVPDDASLAAGVAAGMPLQDAADRSPAEVAMESIAITLLEEISSSTAVGGRHPQRRS